MKSFDTTGYTFQVDGQPYTIPHLNVDSFERVSGLDEIKDINERMRAFRDVLLSVAPDDRTREALGKLGLRQQKELFDDWSGMNGGSDGSEPGEA
jgi:hypothetical protein